MREFIGSCGRGALISLVALLIFVMVYTYMTGQAPFGGDPFVMGTYEPSTGHWTIKGFNGLEADECGTGGAEEFRTRLEHLTK